MKANRKFVQADEAVSPVIAVILMVAITVVLAATVFVLVSDIGGNTGSNTPAVSWAPDETQDRLAITTAAQNADWFRYTIQVDQCTGSDGPIVAGSSGQANGPIAINTAATTTTGAQVSDAACAPNDQRVGAASDRMDATDYVEFCHDGTAGVEATNVKITVKDTTANTVAYTHTFTNVAACVAAP